MLIITLAVSLVSSILLSYLNQHFYTSALVYYLGDVAMGLDWEMLLLASLVIPTRPCHIFTKSNRIGEGKKIARL